MHKSIFTINYLLYFVLTIFLVVETSCKYEEGPLIAFRSKKKRIVNSWQYQLVYRNGLDVTSGAADLSINFANSSIGFNNDNRFTTIINYTDTDTSYTQQFDGSWELIENDEKIFLTYDAPVPNSGLTQSWIITRLKEKILWAEEEFGDNIYQYHLVPTP